MSGAISHGTHHHGVLVLLTSRLLNNLLVCILQSDVTTAFFNIEKNRGFNTSYALFRPDV